MGNHIIALDNFFRPDPLRFPLLLFEKQFVGWQFVSCLKPFSNNIWVSFLNWCFQRGPIVHRPSLRWKSLKSKHRSFFSPTSEILSYSTLFILYHTRSQRYTTFLRLRLLKFFWTLTFEKKNLTRLKGIHLNKTLGTKLSKTCLSTLSRKQRILCLQLASCSYCFSSRQFNRTWIPQQEAVNFWFKRASVPQNNGYLRSGPTSDARHWPQSKQVHCSPCSIRLTETH